MTDEYGNELLHRVLLSAMKDIDKICRENGLAYYLHAGTLLGAVNFHGFIPWDDDVDITMTCADYEKFVKIVERDFADRYFVATFRNEEYHRINNTKLRIKGCFFVLHNGRKEMINIDISPLYNVPDRKAARAFQKNLIKLLDIAVGIKYKEIQPRKLKTKLLAIFSSVISRRTLGEWIEKAMRLENKKTENVGLLYYTAKNPYTGADGYENDTMPAKWYSSPADIKFEDARFMCISSPEKDLIKRYGKDYGKPYPEEKRVTKHEVKSYSIDKDVLARI